MSSRGGVSDHRDSVAAQGQDKPTLNEAVADESWIKAVAKRLLREHGETLRRLAEDD